MKTISGKVIIVVGATGGIGSVLVRVFLEQGAHVVLAARDEKKLEALFAQCDPTRSAYVPSDATSVENIRNLLDFAVKKFGTIDAIVNATGTWSRTSIDNSPEEIVEIFDKHYHALLKTTVVIASVAQEFFRAQGKGLIVNISSHAALRPHLIGNLSYGAMKAASRHFIHSLIYELADTPVRLTDLAPAIVNSGETKLLLDTEEKRALAVQPETIAMWIIDHIDDPDIPEGHLFDSTLVLE